MYTTEDAKSWAAQRSSELDDRRCACGDEAVRMMNQFDAVKSKSLWDSGSWLAEVLRDAGATDAQIAAIQMAQGQRAFGGDPWKAAVDYANEFLSTGDTEEKGGIDLARKRHEELFGSDDSENR